MNILKAVRNLPKFLISTIGCELVGLAGTPFTLSSIPTWYQTLQKPSFSPPNWIFGPVWTILYFLMGVAAYLVWIKGLQKKAVKKALSFFIAQLAFNFLWSILFFGLHSPILALIDILILWALILITTIKFYKISKTASYLLIPYLLWVTFATILNLSIALLNP